MQKLACIAEISTKVTPRVGYFLYTPGILGMIVLGLNVSLRTAWTALALTNWPWSSKSLALKFKDQKLAKIRQIQKHYEIQLRVSRVSRMMTRLLFYPVDSVDLIHLSRRSRLTRLRENSIDSIDRLDPFRGLTYNLSKLGQNDLIVDFWSDVIMHAGLQVSTYCGYDFCHPY